MFRAQSVALFLSNAESNAPDPLHAAQRGGRLDQDYADTLIRRSNFSGPWSRCGTDRHAPDHRPAICHLRGHAAQPRQSKPCCGNAGLIRINEYLRQRIERYLGPGPRKVIVEIFDVWTEPDPETQSQSAQGSDLGSRYRQTLADQCRPIGPTPGNHIIIEIIFRMVQRRRRAVADVDHRARHCVQHE